jgi:hypothetical protein
MRIDVKHLQTATTLRPYRVPEGWKFLGNGDSREAYLGPDRMVYKVPRLDFEQSEQEHARVWRIRRTKLPEWLVIPKVYFHSPTGISVMEYMEGKMPGWCWGECSCGTPVCWLKRLTWIEANLSVYDVHTENVLILADGRIAIIDLGI